MKDLLTSRQVAEHLGRSTSMVSYLANKRGIKPAEIIGNAYLWHARDLPRFEGKETPGPRPGSRRKPKGDKGEAKGEP